MLIYKTCVDMKSIGKEIRTILRKKGISLYRIAKDLGVTRESLYRSLLDDGNPEWKRIREVLDYLDYDFVLKPKRKEMKLIKGSLNEKRKEMI